MVDSPLANTLREIAYIYAAATSEGVECYIPKDDFLKCVSGDVLKRTSLLSVADALEDSFCTDWGNRDNQFGAAMNQAKFLTAGVYKFDRGDGGWISYKEGVLKHVYDILNLEDDLEDVSVSREWLSKHKVAAEPEQVDRIILSGKCLPMFIEGSSY